MVRPPCCDKLSVKKGLWTADEDAKILAYVSKHGTGNWTSVPKKAGLRRCGKSCRLRWTNYLRPDIRHENFTPQEEEMIIRLHAAIGSRWSIIAQQLPGRTDNDVKNYWNTRLRKKLSEMGIDPVTHKPFSQILADYGNIGGIPRSRTRSGSLNRDLKHAFTPRSSPEQMTQLDLNHDKEGIHNQPPDLLAQLQAITLASNRGGGHEIYSPHQFFSECSSSSSAAASPSSSSSTANHGKGGTLGFNWSDFLLEEAFVPETRGDEMENHVDFSPNERERNDLNAHGKQNQEAGEGMDCDRGTIDGSLEASSSSSVKSSFVEAMLGQENDSFLDFCGLLEESYSY